MLSPCLLVQKSIQAGAYDVVVEAFKRCHELGLGRMSANRYSVVIAHLAKQGQLRALLGYAPSAWILPAHTALRATHHIAFSLKPYSCVQRGPCMKSHMYAVRSPMDGGMRCLALSALLNDCHPFAGHVISQMLSELLGMSEPCKMAEKVHMWVCQRAQELIKRLQRDYPQHVRCD